LNKKEWDRLRSQLEALSPKDPHEQSLRDIALAAIQAGRRDEAKSALIQIIVAKAPSADASPDYLTRAGVEAAMGWISMLEHDYAQAAGHFYRAVSQLPASEQTRRRTYREAQADAHYRDGQARGDAKALRHAAKLRRELLKEVPRKQARWVTLQNDIGNALLALGEQESRIGTLKEAAAAFRAALNAWPCEWSPLDRAMLQTKLGVALLRVGEHERRSRSLDEAVSAFQAALAEYKREGAPLQWAMIQNCLGLAFLRLAERESGTARLEHAESAFRAALEERTRDRDPLDWARTQHNLGLALFALGERQSSAARMEDARAAFAAALDERRHDGASLDWAATAVALANVLLSIGTREGGTTRLKEAIHVYEEVLATIPEGSTKLREEAGRCLAEARRLLARRTQ
jgi:tetratricopeptide (TPR) repeat protein